MCEGCKVKIPTHTWWYRGKPYCGPSCQRSGKTQFDKLWKALDKMGAVSDFTRERLNLRGR